MATRKKKQTQKKWGRPVGRKQLEPDEGTDEADAVEWQRVRVTFLVPKIVRSGKAAPKLVFILPKGRRSPAHVKLLEHLSEANIEPETSMLASRPMKYVTQTKKTYGVVRSPRKRK